MEIIKKTIITIPEVKEYLEKVDLEKMDQIQRWTYDYVKEFAKVDAETARRMKNRLIEECNLSEEEAAEIINVMPSTLEELRAFTFGWKRLILTDTLEKILEILKEKG
ncbi:MAG: RNA polymerase Rpb4 [Candidatus Nitrosothermus koennekii]|nr:MAG: RNA polymerase Rpb4 [Candidatus Nitrosothermus koennekii]